MPMQLRQQRADLHVNLALVFQLLQLLRRLLGEGRRQVLRIDLMEAGVEAECALLQSAHLLEAQRHIVHRYLNEEAILWVLLEL